MITEAKERLEEVNMELKPRTVSITKEQDKMLNREAARRQAKTGKTVSVSEVLRDILDSYAKANGNGSNDQ
jgi:hypothetical protein